MLARKSQKLLIKENLITVSWNKFLAWNADQNYSRISLVKLVRPQPPRLAMQMQGSNDSKSQRRSENKYPQSISGSIQIRKPLSAEQTNYTPVTQKQCAQEGKEQKDPDTIFQAGIALSVRSSVQTEMTISKKAKHSSFPVLPFWLLHSQCYSNLGIIESHTILGNTVLIKVNFPSADGVGREETPFLDA